MSESLESLIRQVQDEGFPPDILADALFRDHLGPDNLDQLLARLPEVARAHVMKRLRDPDLGEAPVVYGQVEWWFPERAKQAAAIIKVRHGAWTEEEIAEKRRRAEAYRARVCARLAAEAGKEGAATQPPASPPAKPDSSDR
jgi:hypothetical protein